MNVQVISADDGRFITRTRLGNPERVWVREVVLRCTGVRHDGILREVISTFGDASSPLRAPGGGWDVSMGVEVPANAIWETPQMTGGRAARRLRTAYEREISLRPVR